MGQESMEKKMTRIKICGLKRPEDVEYVNQYLPDYAGFVFAGSKRKVTDEQAEKLSRKLDERIIPVGVFVNEPAEHIVNLVKKGIIRVVQLHGDEDETYILKLRKMLKGTDKEPDNRVENVIDGSGESGEKSGEQNREETIKIIKAVRVQSREEILEAAKLLCDYLLLDTWQKDTYGGCGKQFDKALIPSKLSVPYFLAGGLSAENVQKNIKICHPYAVDVSSAVETDENKDRKKIQEFIERVREYE